MKRTVRATVFSVAAILTAAGGSHAWAEPAPAKSDAPALQGPRVEDGGTPSIRRDFGGGGKDMKGNRPIPPQAFQRALSKLRGEGVSENLRLTEEQEKQIKSVQQEFEAAAAKFREENKAEVEALRAQARAKMDEGGQPDGGLRQKMEELRAKGPDPRDAQVRIMNTLNEAQRQVVQSELDAARDRMNERGARDFAKRQAQNLEGKGRPQGGRGFDPNNLPPRMKERLDKMSPEEREQAMQRLRERASRGGEGSRGGSRGLDRAVLEQLTPEQRAELETMAPAERRQLLRSVRDRMIETGQLPAPQRGEGQPRRRPAPPQDQ